MKVDTLVIGAGPAGLQIGAYLEKAGISYRILERGGAAGTRYETFPHSGELQTFNKQALGSQKNDEFALRHDWNSLLTPAGAGAAASAATPLRFTEFSRDFYPDRDDYVLYLREYAKTYGLKIDYSCPVVRVRKAEKGGYEVHTTPKGETTTRMYSCDRLIVATGLSKPDWSTISDESKRPVRHYADFPADWFRGHEGRQQYANKNVLILGNGNAGYELAGLLTPVAASVTLHGRRLRSLAAKTHYPGDIRGSYLGFQDTCHLRTLNVASAAEDPANFIIQQEAADKPYTLAFKCSAGCETKHPFSLGGGAAAGAGGYDEVIVATGWKFDTAPFEFEIPLTAGGKLPQIKPTFESPVHEGLFFVGAAAQIFDYKKSAGGFVAGYRHLIEFFFHLHYDQKFAVTKIPFSKMNDLVKFILYRMNTAASLYHLHGGMADCFYFEAPAAAPSDTAEKGVVYWTSVLPWMIHTGAMNVDPASPVFVLTLEYGKESLRPVIRVYKGTPRRLIDEITFEENLYSEFLDRDLYYNKVVRLLRGFSAAAPNA